MPYNPTLAEMETVISYDRSSGTASIYTADPVVMRRLEKLCENAKEFLEVKRDEYGRWYQCPKALIGIRKPRQLSAELRENMAQRARAQLAAHQ